MKVKVTTFLGRGFVESMSSWSELGSSPVSGKWLDCNDNKTEVGLRIGAEAWSIISWGGTVENKEKIYKFYLVDKNLYAQSNGFDMKCKQKIYTWNG